MLANNFKEIIAYTAELAEQELTKDDVDLVLHQSQAVLEMIPGLNLTEPNAEVDQVVENMLYTQREITGVRLDNDNSDAQFIVNRFLSYVWDAHRVFYQLGIRSSFETNSANKIGGI